MTLSETILAIIDRGAAQSSEAFWSYDVQDRLVYEMLQSNADSNTLIRYILRAVMRNPNQAAHTNLILIHQLLAEFLCSYEVEFLQWVLQGRGEMARGGFSTDPKNIFEFFASPNSFRSTSRVITGLETILSSLSFRVVGFAWIPEPIPSRENSRKGFESLQEKFRKWIPKEMHVQELYQTRPSDLKPNPEDEIIQAHLDPVSDASDLEDGVPKRPGKSWLPPKMRARIRTVSEAKAAADVSTAHSPYTWVGAASAGGIPYASHVSGTVTLILGVLLSLAQEPQRPSKLTAALSLERLKQSPANVLKFRETLLNIAGILLMPTLERANFHTIPEVFAGIYYFIEKMILLYHPGASEVDLRVLSPYESFRAGISLLSQVSAYPLNTHIAQVQDFLLAKVQAVPFATST